MLVVKVFESKIVRRATVTLFILYFVSMFIAPWFTIGLNWEKYQNILYTWQSLNVGVLAFAASVIALSISRYQEEKQREREFTAAKSFLPSALSTLCGYLDESGKFYASKLKVINYRANVDPDYSGAGGYGNIGPQALPVPDLDNNYALIFKECIRHSSPEVGEYLANILRKLQIHQSRMQNKSEKSHLFTISCIYSILEIRTLVNCLYAFARDEESFDKIKPLDAKLMYDAYCNLNMYLDSADEAELLEMTNEYLASNENI